MEEKKRTPFNPKTIAIGCLIVVILYLITCPMMSAKVLEVNIGKCISISLFGKLELRDIDKAVITKYDKQITITNQGLIKQITDETRIATHVRSHCGGPGKCDDPYKRIDLYQGDTLVRSMEWHACCDMVRVYEEDATHWLIPWWCPSQGGFIYLSEELASQLNALMNAG